MVRRTGQRAWQTPDKEVMLHLTIAALIDSANDVRRRSNRDADGRRATTVPFAEAFPSAPRHFYLVPSAMLPTGDFIWSY
jgi:hypothetical protein